MHEDLCTLELRSPRAAIDRAETGTAFDQYVPLLVTLPDEFDRLFYYCYEHSWESGRRLTVDQINQFVLLMNELSESIINVNI